MVAPKRRTLDISDIQDEADIYDRIVIRQKRKAKKAKISEDPYDELSSPVLLAGRVKHVQDRLSNPFQRTPETESLAKSEEWALSDEEQPAIVESEELQNERAVKLIPDVSTRCRAIVDSYEALSLHEMFSDPLTNCMFRLFLYGVGFDQHAHFKFPQEKLFVRILRNIISKQTAREGIRDRFVDKYESTPEPEATPEPFQSDIVRTTEKIVVPKRVLLLLPTLD